MRLKHGQTVQAIMDLLAELGPMTRAEIGQHLKAADTRDISPVMARMILATPRRPKRLYILGYTDDAEGQRRYPRAIYAIGDKPDAVKPKPDPKANRRRYDAKKRAIGTANFVFNLALPRRVYERRL
jgi:hypothetical protein